jgi:GntR family transcriptional regulator / MocR family aminotransferase
MELSDTKSRYTYPMHIPLDPASTTPLYRQIEYFLREAILSGALAANTRLPATRRLAEELGVSRITVKNAYAELESDGLIASREGSGTDVLQALKESFPAQANNEQSWPLWQQAYLKQRAVEVSSQLPPMKTTSLISFTGVGDAREYPIAEFRKAMQDVLRREGISALAYGNFQGGYLPLRRTIVHLLASQGIRTQPESILVTSGSQQALALVCQVLLKAGDVVLVESPTYNFALELFRTMQLSIIPVPVDEHGMQVELLEPLLQQLHPRLIYTIPNFQNPSGVCLSTSRRRVLVALANRYNVPICEDDFVGDLRYESRSKPALKALDPGGGVIYIGTFSKMLMPGLRVGYIVADGPVLPVLIEHKRTSDLTTTPLLQYVLHEFVNVGRYQAHLRRSCRLYRHRRDALVQALRQYFGHELDFVIPQGGLFLWLKLPVGFSSTLLSLAVQEGVEFAPGTRFFIDPQQGESYLRLNFAALTTDEIEEGIQRLRLAYQRM